ncbi:rna-directed dna polymerase from mobile element jockey-like [Limosa lapponica baueri]|uniref:Rna-directed dna polymerase from mobile element jockey-like n=1 Tax=Limosa lapponica baueri TaxID=1758121 RepID=A0A2I0U2Q3_LIMLA|nr:rna-directed dna polymerase from mobile element jockey-like [Limosa lapponica baueri]
MSFTPTYKKGCKEDLENYRPVSLTFVSGYGQVILSAIIWHIQENQVIGHGFMKGTSFLTNLVFYDKISYLVDEGKPVEVVVRYVNELRFDKSFGISRNCICSLKEELASTVCN